MAMRKIIRRLYAIQVRERKYLISEFSKIRGLMPLLMKRRNGQPWTKEDRRAIIEHFQRISDLSPYLIPLLLPGGIFLLPLFVWWLDRRRQQRITAETAILKPVEVEEIE